MSDEQPKESLLSRFTSWLRSSSSEKYLHGHLSQAKSDITHELQNADKRGNGNFTLEKDEVEKAAPRIKELFQELLEKYPHKKNDLFSELSNAKELGNQKDSSKLGNRTGIVFDREGFRAYMDALREVVPTDKTLIEPKLQATLKVNTEDRGKNR